MHGHAAYYVIVYNHICISTCAFLWSLYILDNVVITGCTDDNLGSVQFQSKYTINRVYVPLMMVKGMCCIVMVLMQPLVHDMNPSYDDKFYCSHAYSVGYNGIGTAGAQALAKGLQHCTNLQELK